MQTILKQKVLKILSLNEKKNNFMISDYCDMRMSVLPLNAENWICNKPVKSNHIAKNSRCEVLCKTGYQLSKGKIKITDDLRTKLIISISVKGRNFHRCKNIGWWHRPESIQLNCEPKSEYSNRNSFVIFSF